MIRHCILLFLPRKANTTEFSCIRISKTEAVSVHLTFFLSGDGSGETPLQNLQLKNTVHCPAGQSHRPLSAFCPAGATELNYKISAGICSRRAIQASSGHHRQHIPNRRILICRVELQAGPGCRPSSRTSGRRDKYSCPASSAQGWP